MDTSIQGPSCAVDKSCCGDASDEVKLEEVNLVEPSCTLNPAEMLERMARWRQLFAVCISRDVGKTEATFRFANTARVKFELEELVKLEKICCANVSWRITEADSEIILTLIADEGSIQPLANGFLKNSALLIKENQ